MAHIMPPSRSIANASAAKNNAVEVKYVDKRFQRNSPYLSICSLQTLYSSRSWLHVDGFSLTNVPSPESIQLYNGTLSVSSIKDKSYRLDFQDVLSKKRRTKIPIVQRVRLPLSQRPQYKDLLTHLCGRRQNTTALAVVE